MNIFDIKLEDFSFDQELINQRIRRKISIGEYFGLLIALGFTFIFIWNSYHYKIGAVDLIHSYLPAGRGDFSEFRYPYWIVPVFQILEELPFLFGYGIWMVLNIFCVLFATRVFGGKPILALASYQMLYVLYYGQITGLLVFGLAIAWWGMSNKRFYIAGFGLLLSATKPQVGLIMGLLLFLFADVTWTERAKILIVPIIISAISIIIWPGWPQDVILTLINNPLNTNGDFSLWQWIGFWSLLLYLPVLIIPFSGTQKLLMIFITFILSFPYFQHTGLLILFCLPIGWIPLLGYIGVLRSVIGWTALKLIVVLPLVLYLYLIIQHFKTRTDNHDQTILNNIKKLFTK